MTIRLTQRSPHIHPNSGEISLGTLGPVVARADTREEAEQARRAFENVLAPRFTRDEAIAIVLAATKGRNHEGSIECDWCGARSKGFGGTATSAQVCPAKVGMHGIRLALVALADAGVFGDVPSPEQGPSQTMRDLLDAAGIR